MALQLKQHVIAEMGDSEAADRTSSRHQAAASLKIPYL